MVKVELSYNPYLLKTKVLFNDQEPRINSLVEKYRTTPLQSWINKVPVIFRDEMNGYDFELVFSGPDLDCDELTAAFRKANVNDDEVHIFHKDTLEDRNTKIKELNDLQQWLKNNPSRLFDYAQFAEENRELLEGDYTYVTLNGDGLDTGYFADKDIAVENIEDVSELDNTDLSGIPILLYISNTSALDLQKNILYLMKRKDVFPNQLFFMISPGINTDKVVKLVKDLGVDHPNVVKSLEDSAVLKYIELYPFTDYIKEAIKKFRSKAEEIRLVINDDKNRSSETQSSAQENIDKLDNTIENLKEAELKFSKKFNFEMTEDMRRILHNHIKEIENWKKKKTVTTNRDEAKGLAEDFDRTALKIYASLINDLNINAVSSVNSIEKLFMGWYKDSSKDDFEPDIEEFKLPENKSIRQYSEELLKIKTQREVEQKDDIVGMIFRQGNPEKKTYIQTTYSINKWREFALDELTPVFSDTADLYVKSMTEYFDQLRINYHEHIDKLIADFENQKENAEAKLTDDEKNLQNEISWFRKLDEQLDQIERG